MKDKLWRLVVSWKTTLLQSLMCWMNRGHVKCHEQWKCPKIKVFSVRKNCSIAWGTLRHDKKNIKKPPFIFLPSLLGRITFTLERLKWACIVWHWNIRQVKNYTESLSSLNEFKWATLSRILEYYRRQEGSHKALRCVNDIYVFIFKMQNRRTNYIRVTS